MQVGRFKPIVGEEFGPGRATVHKKLEFDFKLTPAYDVTFAHNPRGEWTSQHLMSINGKFKGFTEDDLLAEADRFAIGTARRVIDQARQAVLSWPLFATRAGVSGSELERIQAQLLPRLA